MPRPEQAIDDRFQPIVKRLNTGLSFYRLAAGEQLEDMCDDLYGLMKLNNHPSEVILRDVGAERSSPAIQLLNSNEVSGFSNQIGRIPVHQALREIYRSTPTLDDKLYFEFTDVDSNTDPKTGTEYINLKIEERGRSRLRWERNSILRAIEKAAKQPALDWHTRKLDITMAGVEASVSQDLRAEIAGTMARSLPIKVILLEAIHNPHE